MNERLVNGFSKLKKEEKQNMVAGWVSDRASFLSDLVMFELHDDTVAEKLSGISENVISTYPFPYSVAPNFLLNGTLYHLPLVTEESSVVAAASAGAKFWAMRGGFRASVPRTLKPGQVHFTWKGTSEELGSIIGDFEKDLRDQLKNITARMEERGGGITGMELIDLTAEMENYYQLRIWFETGDSMGANFINSCLEKSGRLLASFLAKRFPGREGDYELIMAILSNYTPECLVEIEAGCPLSALDGVAGEMTGLEFAEKFKKAVDISLIDTFRAVTHNKGIFNGIDALMLATGNDFRAVEANAHAYAARDGHYRGLSWVRLTEDKFTFGLRVPMTVGTVGGLTRIHPMAHWSFDILGNPSAVELMMIAAAAGLACNFSAIRALITSGIQQGHMKMHLSNILNSLDADPVEKRAVLEHFEGQTVTYSDVRQFLDNKRKGL